MMEYLKNHGVSRSRLAELAGELQDSLRQLNLHPALRVRVYAQHRPPALQIVVLRDDGTKYAGALAAAADVLYHDESRRLLPCLRPDAAEKIARSVKIID